MHYLATALVAFALAHGGLADNEPPHIITYTGFQCTGEATSSVVGITGCVAPPPPEFRSYKENGWGPHHTRIGFYEEGTCRTQLFDTWAYDGDYFQSHQCYDVGSIAAHENPLGPMPISASGLLLKIVVDIGNK
ncbi:hypothetical protein B0H65DRAFT_587087 [Neurospora tetraspora]|uniref:Uncharacterized protein n=1 Tax=Neurospora tetraspora TaxID=94610 RepID=A0AAE0JM05_9PEZI|nr:hypothetical protein B0H65DRAFT_587087 [Neurospora tetraspora]